MQGPRAYMQICLDGILIINLMHYNNILDIKELLREERYFSLSLTLLTSTDFSSRPIRGAWMSGSRDLLRYGKSQ